VRPCSKELIALQRGLLREGKGDVAAYVLKADAYFSGCASTASASLACLLHPPLSPESAFIQLTSNWTSTDIN